MKVAIILYPGSNCADDIKRYFENKGDVCFYIWHKESDHTKFLFDLLIVPGGFAFGDRYYEKATDNYTINPGKMALESPVSKIILDASNKKKPIVGICNGFQILTKMGLLPGNLELNVNKRFTCDRIKCRIDSCSDNIIDDNIIDVANSYGNYQCSPDILSELKDNGQIFIRYDDEDYSKNINGSIENIAGICDINHLIYGMMPHPERAIEQNNCRIYNIIKKVVDSKNNNNFSKSIETLMHSEHISYKSTRKYLKNMYTQGDHVIQGPGENAGIVDIGDGYCLALRVESHNHPIFIDPYNGAATGVGGIMRDIFTMGARPIAVCDFLRFGTDDNSDKLLKETVRGISDYGNCFGVANVGGNCYRDKMYNKNPLLNVACIGIMRKESIVYGNALNDGDLLIYVGSKTGNEGVNGAEMASNSFSSDTDLDKLKSNIQTGDPFLEKLLLEACLEIIDNKLIYGMQDMGAGGLLCASLEVVQRGRSKTGKNLGCSMYVNKIPTKYEMDDCDKIISESQERMLLVADSKNKDQIFEIFKKWDLEHSVVGSVNINGKYRVINSDTNVELYVNEIDNFTDIKQNWIETEFNYKTGMRYIEPDNTLWKTYDSTIGGRTILSNRDHFEKTQQCINYSLMAIYEINKTLIISWGKDFEECYDTITDNGFKHLGLINCLNYGHPSDSIGELAKFVTQLTDKCKLHEVPILGGNVSLYNATDGVSINPSPLIVMIGIK
jgi:phosphoribosylformylglycinamidine synthase II/phosphoribosylformylglycinamidine synthase I